MQHEAVDPLELVMIHQYTYIHIYIYIYYMCIYYIVVLYLNTTFRSRILHKNSSCLVDRNTCHMQQGVD
jgi:hypothetical protein